jgi:hypothetical protein
LKYFTAANKIQQAEEDIKRRKCNKRGFGLYSLKEVSQGILAVSLWLKILYL